LLGVHCKNTPTTVQALGKTHEHPTYQLHTSLPKMHTDEFDMSLPSIRQVQNLIKKSAPTEFKLLTGDVLTGRVIWQDQYCVCLVDEKSQQMTVWKQALAYIKPITPN